MKSRLASHFSIILVLIATAGLILLLASALRAQNQPSRSSLNAPWPAGSLNAVPVDFPATSLWIYANGSVSNSALKGSVYGTTPGSPYFLLSRPSLSSTDAWWVERLLIGAAGKQTPFLVPISNQPG